MQEVRQQGSAASVSKRLEGTACLLGARSGPLLSTHPFLPNWNVGGRGGASGSQGGCTGQPAQVWGWPAAAAAAQGHAAQRRVSSGGAGCRGGGAPGAARLSLWRPARQRPRVACAAGPCAAAAAAGKRLGPRGQRRPRGRHGRRRGRGGYVPCQLAMWCALWPCSQCRRCRANVMLCLVPALLGRAEDEGGVRAGAIVGTCEEMCPPVERERRSRLSDIQVRRRRALFRACTGGRGPRLACVSARAGWCRWASTHLSCPACCPCPADL